MVPITPCNAPLVGIVGVLTRMEGKFKALKGEAGRTVTNQVMPEIADISVNMYVNIDIREVT